MLEVGAGSGYAAAVMAEIAGEMHAIARHAELADAAAARLAGAGCENVEVHVGDGTLGWPRPAPFDAIVVAAGEPSMVPATDGCDVASPFPSARKGRGREGAAREDPGRPP